MSQCRLWFDDIWAGSIQSAPGSMTPVANVTAARASGTASDTRTVRQTGVRTGGLDAQSPPA